MHRGLTLTVLSFAFLDMIGMIEKKRLNYHTKEETSSFRMTTFVSLAFSKMPRNSNHIFYFGHSTSDS